LSFFLLVLSLQSATELHWEPWDIMETPWVYGWTCATAVSGTGRILFDGEPAVLAGDPGLPPWGSFPHASQLNPLEGGLWSSSDWSLDFAMPEIPDSSYESMVGLLENTSDRNRYMGYLRRPLPLDILFDLSVDRNDSLNSQRITLERGPFDFSARFRQGDGDRYMLGCGWSDGGGIGIRTSFARMYDGGRQAGLLGSFSVESPLFSLQAGAGGAWLKDSVLHGELHLLTRYRPGRFTITARGDLTDDDGEFSPGGALGCGTEFGPLGLQAGAYAPPGEDIRLLVQANAGPAAALAVLDDGRLSAGAQLDFTMSNLMARGSVTMTGEDTVSVAGVLLPSVRYWNALISAGARCDLDWIDGDGWSGTADLLSTFTLGRFALMVAVENVDDDYARSWTYGITWEFTDTPPFSDEESGSGGGED
jgi:hypothetical protein